MLIKLAKISHLRQIKNINSQKLKDKSISQPKNFGSLPKNSKKIFLTIVYFQIFRVEKVVCLRILRGER